jgi:ribosomal protein S18 acetylase RimI-like enzyme
MEYTLRVSSNEDFEFCYRLNELNFRPLVERLRGWNDEIERLDMQSKFKPGEDVIVIIDRKDVGHFSIVEERDRIFLRMLVLHPEIQSQGLGAKLMQEILSQAAWQNKPIILWVTEQNVKAVKFYRKIGFEVLSKVVSLEKRVSKLEMIATPKININKGKSRK